MGKKPRKVTAHKKRKGSSIPMVLKDTSGLAKKMKDFWK